MANVTVDQDTCTGCGVCTNMAPQIFELGDNNKAVAKMDEVEGDDKDKAEQAEDACPVNAISVQ